MNKITKSDMMCINSYEQNINCNKEVIKIVANNQKFNSTKEALAKGFNENDIQIFFKVKGIGNCVSSLVNYIGYSEAEYIIAKQKYNYLLKNIPRSLLNYIKTRDNKDLGIGSDYFLDKFNHLLLNGKVQECGLSVCGKYTSKSWNKFTAWHQIINKAKKLGYKIDITNLNPSNAWATANGGWNHHNEYILIK